MTQAVVSRRELDWFLSQRKSQRAVSEETENLASAYADWLSRSTGKKYRLPNDDELEYACIADGTMPVWVQTETRATPDASANVAELNAWGFMDLPDASTEFTSGDSQNPHGAWLYSDRTGVRFRVVREPEKKQSAANVISGSTNRTPTPPRPASPGKS
jgi:formylglycine-generating enzyme required for sulfatase activity